MLSLDSCKTKAVGFCGQISTPEPLSASDLSAEAGFTVQKVTSGAHTCQKQYM